MLLALDIGNSSVSVGVFDISEKCVNENKLIHQFKIAAKGLSADEYAMQMYHFLKLQNILPSKRSSYFRQLTDCNDPSGSDFSVNHAVISSVVPSFTDVIAKAAELLIGSKSFLIGAGVKTGFGIRIKNPEQLGADIVSNTAYAASIVPGPLVILDVGTATTLTVVDKEKNLLGTIIMPGLRVSLQALSGSAAQLSEIPLAASDVLIGRDSAESVRSGVVNGHCIMIDGFVRNIREFFASQGEESKLSLVSTGGLSHIVLPHLRNKFADFEALTLLGAANIFLLNHKKL